MPIARVATAMAVNAGVCDSRRRMCLSLMKHSTEVVGKSFTWNRSLWSRLVVGVSCVTEGFTSSLRGHFGGHFGDSLLWSEVPDRDSLAPRAVCLHHRSMKLRSLKGALTSQFSLRNTADCPRSESEVNLELEFQGELHQAGCGGAYYASKV